MLNNNFIYKFYYEWWKNIDKSILFLIILLFGLGLFFSLVSTSLIVSDKLSTNSYYFFFKHLFFIGLGFFFYNFLFFSKTKKFTQIIIFFIYCLLYFFIISSNCRDRGKRIEKVVRFFLFTKISAN